MQKKDLIRKITELQQQLAGVMRPQVSDVWMEMNLTVPQLKSLFFIAREGRSANSRKLAAALGVTPANVTSTVDRLVQQGLVSRTENPEDRRVLLLKATPEGEALLANLSEMATNHMSKLLERMGVNELANLALGLSSLIKAAEFQEGGNDRDEYD